MAKKSEVYIYPFFHECGKYTLDPFWKEKFEELANNIFPDGLRYDQKNNRFMIEGVSTPLPVKVTDAYKKILDVLKNKFKIYSNRELSEKYGEEEFKKKVETIEFKSVKSKHTKEQLIMEYASKLKKEYNLTPSEFSNLLATIQLAFQFKSLTVDDVEYDGTIKKIEGLKFSKDNRTFLVPEAPVTNSKSEKPQNSDKFKSAVKKYFKEDDLRKTKLFI